MTTPRRSSEPFHRPGVEQALVFGAGFGVAPQLGRAQHLALIVEQHQAVLLAGDTDAEDRLPVDIGCEQGAAGGEGEGVQPLLGVLLAAAVGAADHRVAARLRRAPDRWPRRG
jgi:hypothetical protein